MKIKRDVNGVEMEFELTDNERIRAYEEQEHVFDVDFIEGIFGADERFDGLSEEEKAKAFSSIAYRYRDLLVNNDDPDLFELASDAVEEYFTALSEKGRYEADITIDVVGGDEKTLNIKMSGNDLSDLKAGILPAVQKACAERGYYDNQVVVGVLIEEDGRWLDTDEETFDLSELNVWIGVYKDALGYNVDESLNLDGFLAADDNLTDILVPRAWLLAKLKAEGETDIEGWFEEYTADSTDMMARDAVDEGVILSCSDKRISCVLGLGESFLNVNDYGKRLAEHMREVYYEAYKKDDYVHFGTDVCVNYVKNVEEAAGWCLLTYGDRALSEIQHEWIECDKETEVYGFDIYAVADVLDKCIVPVKENALMSQLENVNERAADESGSTVEPTKVQYTVYGVNSMGSTWYLSNPKADSCTLWTGAPKEMRATFASREEALEKAKELDEIFRFGSTRHFVEEVKVPEQSLEDKLVTRYTIEYYASVYDDEDRLTDYIYADSQEEAIATFEQKHGTECIITMCEPIAVPARYKEYDLETSSLCEKLSDATKRSEQSEHNCGKNLLDYVKE